MTYFQNAPDCIIKIKKLIKAFPEIEHIIQTGDYKDWEQQLSAAVDIQEHLAGKGVIYNLLNALAVAVFEHENKTSDQTANPILTKLENWLVLFPELQGDKKFKHKIKNLDGFNFLASLSELSIAALMKQQGYQVAFEHKFLQINSQKKKDVDVKVTDANGNIVFIEVYMPIDLEVEDGFFEKDDGEHYFKYKVALKLTDKFGVDGTVGLNGKVLLAINYAAFVAMQRKEVFKELSGDQMYMEMQKALPDGIDGLLIFRDDFTSSNSFHFEKLILKD